MARKFQANDAVRDRVPMLVGLTGPSGSGKTLSALRMATGMREAIGGEIFYVDTESKRALHYADEFDFKHVPFEPPFSPSDYVEVLKYCQDQGASVIVVDSMSHEHEGPGGLLEMHEAELQKRAGNDWAKQQRVNMACWIKPKAERRKLIHAVLGMGINAIFCFRAKEKIKPVQGKEPLHLGWQAIAGEEFVFEMMCNVLLYPGGKGRPVWEPEQPGEKTMIKLPGYLEHCFPKDESISEETGRLIAAWAAGEKTPEQRLDELHAAVEKCPDLESLQALWEQIKSQNWAQEPRGMLRAAVMARKIVLEQGSDPADPQDGSPGTGDSAASHDGHDSTGDEGVDGPTDPEPPEDGSGGAAAPGPDDEPEDQAVRDAFGLGPEEG